METFAADRFLALDPESLPSPLRALWHDGHDDWKHAHEEAQAGEDRESAWVHAYLHRKEGDHFNADYWYRRAGKPVFRGDLSQEWSTMTAELWKQP